VRKNKIIVLFDKKRSFDWSYLIKKNEEHLVQVPEGHGFLFVHAVKVIFCL